MPCGGIRLAKGPGTVNTKLLAPDGGCWVCLRGGCRHFCDEWDTYIHALCALKWLSTEEGEIIIHHGHTIILDFCIEEKLPKGKSKG